MMYGWGGFPGGWMMHGFGAVGIVALVINLLWIAIVIFGIYLLIRALSRRSFSARLTHHREGEEYRILRQRYARGEIDAQEYQRILDELMKAQP
ncbi:SHOCT domain-containing protein [Alicyclobacillus sp. ALC3]|uniref:SHOCT domain-containing protein n=1 Tax=Alicyclobacillus sp. ALC3 TaxID=2796143 RepID=UPI002378B41A|nr:SHOCT domain-containing protein [Alicyclobacillus sp. ALC3]WDL95808.1 SHOCT domain-containing protein [Alicyclobacillus sp. ALC3]